MMRKEPGLKVLKKMRMRILREPGRPRPGLGPGTARLFQECDDPVLESLAQLDCRQGEGGEHGGDEPEADDYLRFGPAFFLEMMMQR